MIENNKTNTEPPEHREADATQPFEIVLAESTFSPNRAINPLIRRIVLGAYGTHADQLLRITQDHHDNPEAAKIVSVNNDGTVSESDEVFIGTSTEVVIPFQKYGIVINPLAHILPRRYMQNKYIGTVMHTHPQEYPFSPVDIWGLLVSEEEFPYARTAAFAITPQLRMLLFRGQNSPKFTPEQTTSLINQYKESLDIGYNELKEGNLHWTYAARLNAHLLALLTEGYDLRLYTGSNRQNIVTAVDSSSLRQT